jgi:hypothetical protein
MAPAVISSITAIMVAVFGWKTAAKLGEIHVLVNGRLTEALNEIDKLKAMIPKNGGGGDWSR